MLTLLLIGQFALAQHFNFDDLFGPNPKYSGQKLAIQSHLLKDYETWRLNGGVLIPNLTHPQFEYYVRHHTQLYADFEKWIPYYKNSEDHKKSVQKILVGLFKKDFGEKIEFRRAKDAIDRFLGRWIKKSIPRLTPFQLLMNENNLRARYRTRFPDFDTNFVWHSNQFYQDLYRINQQIDTQRISFKPENIIADFKELLILIRMHQLSAILKLPVDLVEYDLSEEPPKKVKLSYQEFMSSQYGYDKKMKKFILNKNGSMILFSEAGNFLGAAEVDKYLDRNSEITAFGPSNFSPFGIQASNYHVLKQIFSMTVKVFNQLQRNPPKNQTDLNSALAQLNGDKIYERLAEIHPAVLYNDPSILQLLPLYERRVNESNLPDWTVPLQEKALQYFASEGKKLDGFQLKLYRSEISDQTFLSNKSLARIEELRKQILFDIDDIHGQVSFLAILPSKESEPTFFSEIQNQSQTTRSEQTVRLRVLPSFIEKQLSLQLPTPPFASVQSFSGQDYKVFVNSKSNQIFLSNGRGQNSSVELDFALPQKNNTQTLHAVSRQRFKQMVSDLQAMGFSELAQKLGQATTLFKTPSLDRIVEIVSSTGRYSYQDNKSVEFSKSEPLQSLKGFLNSDGVAQYQCEAAAQLLLFILQHSVVLKPGYHFELVGGYNVRSSQITAANAHVKVGLFLHGQLIALFDGTPILTEELQKTSSNLTLRSKIPSTQTEPIWKDEVRFIQTDLVLQEFFKLKPDASHPVVRLLKLANDLLNGRNADDKATLEQLILEQDRMLKIVQNSAYRNPNFENLRKPEFLNLGYALVDALKKASQDSDHCLQILKGAL